MSKKTPTITATKRERTGTRYAQRLRAAGQLPAVVYGHGVDPLAISVDEKTTLSHLTDGAHVIELDIEGESKETCLIKDLQFGWLGDNVIHLDLTRVNLEEVVTVNVKLVFVGTPESSKKTGSILVHEINELEVTCKVRDIPEEIIVHLEDMQESFCVSELDMPNGVDAVAEPTAMVCHIVFKAEEIEEPAEGAEADAKDTTEEATEDSPNEDGGGS